MGRLARHTPSLLTPILLLFATCGTLAKTDGCMHDNSDVKCLKSGLLLSTADPKEEQSIESRSLKSGQSSLPASVSFEKVVVESEQTPRNSITYLIDDDWLKAHKNDLNAAVKAVSDGDEIVFQVSPKTVKLKTTLIVDKSITFITRPTPTTGEPSPVGMVTYLQCPSKWAMMKIKASKVVFDGFVLTGCLKSRQDNMIMVFEDKEVDFNNVYFLRNEAAIFFMRERADLEISNSIFQYTYSGRARIFDTTEGKVTAINSSFEDNASGSSNRALLSFERGSEGKFKKCRFINNRSKGQGGVFLANANSTLDIEDCYFTRNHADHGSCVKAKTSHVKITRSTFFDNDAKTDGGALNGWNASHFIITQSTFTKNKGINAGAFFVGNRSNVELTECTFDSNYARDTGGAIRTEVNTSIAIHRCNFTANTCRGHGAVIHSLTNSTVHVCESVFDKNQAVFLSGAIGAHSGSQLKVENSNFTENRAAHGGAIRLEAHTFGSFSGCNFIDNLAIGAGGAINLWIFAKASIANCSIQNSVGGYGAAIFLGAVSTIDVLSSDITNSTAKGRGAAIKVSFNSTLILKDAIIKDNSGFSGGGLYIGGVCLAMISSCKFINNTARVKGGGIWSQYSYSVDICDSEFLFNHAKEAGGFFDEGQTVVNIKDTKFVNNTALKDTGGLFVFLGGKANITNSVFSKNYAGHHGGGLVAAVQSKINVKSCSFIENSAHFDGGGLVAFNESTMTLSDTTFKGNHARNGAGFVLGAFSSGEADTMSFDTNNATHEGGALVVFKNTTFTMSKANFINNSAGAHGGAGRLHVSTRNIFKYCKFASNSAGHDGGSLSVFDNSLLSLAVCSFDDDVAGEHGGSISAHEECRVIIYRVNITDSTAGKHGGCISVHGTRSFFNKMNMKNCSSEGPGTSFSSFASRVYFNGVLYTTPSGSTGP